MLTTSGYGRDDHPMSIHEGIPIVRGVAQSRQRPWNRCSSCC
jgi:hypothetical protein